MAIEIPRKDFVWQQGEDGEISLVYKAGDPAEPVDLTGYKLRMDIRASGGSTPLYTFNSDDADAETPDEAVLTADGEINIVIPRTVSLPAGPLASTIGQALNYDIFVRNPDGKQKKFLKGTVTIEASETLWT